MRRILDDAERRPLDTPRRALTNELFVTSAVRSGHRRRVALTVALFVTLALVTAGLVAQPPAGPPAPREVIGFEPGKDYHLADFRQLREYFRRLDVASDRVKVFVAGHSTGGNEMLVAVLSSAENMARLDAFRDASRRLALARIDDHEARALAQRGKAIVWIDNGLHANEVASAQHAMVLAHQVATSEDDEIRAIRENVILVLLPSVNPDGMDLVVDWYRQNLGTPHQDSPLPRLYHEYVGHDNNRDFFMQTQRETQVLNRLLYAEWLPQVMYNQHQGVWPARMFVPPFPEPINPHIDAAVMRGVDRIGSAIHRRLQKERKDGVISRYAFSAWYNGSIRTTSYFHNVIGILTETGHASATPHRYDASTFPRELVAGVPSLSPSENYPQPWTGGTLRLRDAIEYMRSGSLAVLDFAARHREELLYGIYDTGRRQIEKGRTEPPMAYVIPAEQHDRSAARAFIDVLLKGGLEVHQAAAPLVADGVTHPEGTWVVSLAQPFRPLVRDLIEPIRYPEVRRSPGEQPAPPYDAAGWTLAYQMGMRVLPVLRAFDGSVLVAVRESRPGEHTFDVPRPQESWGYALDPSDNAAISAAARMVGRGLTVRRTIEAINAAPGVTVPAGAWIVEGRRATDEVRRSVRKLGLRVWLLERMPARMTTPLMRPRVGLYRSWVANIDEGWARWLLDQHGIEYESLSDSSVRAGRLRDRFDVILLPDQNATEIVRGHQPTDRPPRPGPWAPVPPEFQGGIGREGVTNLKAFVASGGTLVAFDRATDLPLTRFGATLSRITEVTGRLRREDFYCPGSVLRLMVDTRHPTAWGMQADAAAFFQGSRAFATSDPQVRSVARYGLDAERLLLSGWLVGAQHIAGQHAVLEVPYHQGRVVLFGFRPHFRGQSHGTFKLLFNLLLGKMGSGGLSEVTAR
jgi:hypothetical protein